MSDDDDLPPGMKPAESSYSRGFVRGEATYVPGAEPMVGGQYSGRRLATCVVCRSTWNVPPDQPGVEHPELNRFRERCPLAGTWLWTTGAVVRG